MPKYFIHYHRVSVSEGIEKRVISLLLEWMLTLTFLKDVKNALSYCILVKISKNIKKFAISAATC